MTSTRISVTRALAPPAQHRLQPCRQRPGPERLRQKVVRAQLEYPHLVVLVALRGEHDDRDIGGRGARAPMGQHAVAIEPGQDRKSTRLNSSHLVISYAVFCLKKKKKKTNKETVDINNSTKYRSQYTR